MNRYGQGKDREKKTQEKGVCMLLLREKAAVLLDLPLRFSDL
jgi:hypothetical protein